MKNSRPLVLAGLILLFVAVMTVDVSFWLVEAVLGRHLPWIILGVVLLFVLFSDGGCSRGCCEPPEEATPDV